MENQEQINKINDKIIKYQKDIINLYEDILKNKELIIQELKLQLTLLGDFKH